LHLLDFVEKLIAVIRFGVMFLDPKLTRNNAASISKEPGIKIALNNGIRFLRKGRKRILFSGG
jgi:hypothetical protein